MPKSGDASKKSLEEYLDEAVARKENAQLENQKRKSDDEGFIQAFRTVRDDKIKPILEDARTPFVEKGLRSEIVSDDLSITLILEPDPGVRAELKYQALVKTRLVYVLSIAGPVIPLGSTVIFGGAHRPGEYLPEDLTTDLVDSHVNDLLEALKGELKKISGASS